MTDANTVSSNRMRERRELGVDAAARDPTIAAIHLDLADGRRQPIHARPTLASSGR